MLPEEVGPLLALDPLCCVVADAADLHFYLVRTAHGGSLSPAVHAARSWLARGVTTKP